MNIDDFPPVLLAHIEVEVSPQFSGQRELTPHFDRQPYGDWCSFFRMSCEQSATLDWKRAGFAECAADAVDDASAELHRATSEANVLFVDFLRKAASTQKNDVADLLVLESSNHSSREAGRHYLCNGSY